MTGGIKCGEVMGRGRKKQRRDRGREINDGMGNDEVTVKGTGGN